MKNTWACHWRWINDTRLELLQRFKKKLIDLYKDFCTDLDEILRSLIFY